MNLLKPFEFVPGVKWFESEMHDTLFQHSVFGAIVFLIVSNTGVYKFVKDLIFQCCGVKLDGNTLQLVHAVVFMVIMYFGSMYLFAPLLGEGMYKKEGFNGENHLVTDSESMLRCLADHSITDQQRHNCMTQWEKVSQGTTSTPLSREQIAAIIAEYSATPP